MKKSRHDFCLFNFEISTFCNAKCPTCSRTYGNQYYVYGERKIKNKHLSIEDFENIILNNSKVFKKLKYKTLIAKFCGELGDPLMHPKLSDITGLAELVFDKVEIFTNGGLRNPSWIKKFLNKNKKTNFVFGIDGITDNVNQKYRINVNTKLALNNMLESAKHRYTRWDFTIFNHNHKELLDVIEFSKQYNIDLLCRFNGRPYSIITDENLKKCEKILRDNDITFYSCKQSIKKKNDTL